MANGTYPLSMRTLYSIYPLGSAATALLLVRLLLAAHLIYSAWGLAFHFPGSIEIGLVVCGIGLAVGFVTPLWAVVCAFLSVGELVGASGPLSIWLSFDALPAIAVVLAGPGGFSIDARLFGREVIEWNG
ncbi:MAG TPA: hypothetical protein VHY79_15845 [Rhizomicrobium sp.]|nr:hypothetical protein [Rhizomicrobium sp.]